MPDAPDIVLCSKLCRHNLTDPSIELRVSTAPNFTRDQRARIKNLMAAFSLRLDLAIEVNRHFLEKEYGDLSNLSNCFEFRNKFLYVK